MRVTAAGPRAGRFVVVEGLDGVGKSTVARELACALGALHLATPDDELREARRLLEPLLDGHANARMLWYAATVMRVSDRVRAARAAGRAIVVDRYILSTLVYGELRGADLQLADVVARLVVPDATIYLHATRACRAARLQGRQDNSCEDARTLVEEADVRLDAAYRRHGARPLAGRFIPIDTTNRSPAAVVAVATAELVRLGRAAAARTLRALRSADAASAPRRAF